MIPLSILIPTKNEEKNLARCLEPIYKWADEVLVIDSNSTDSTLSIAAEYNARVIQFDYKGGWPKKRQWALNNVCFRNQWVLLLDSDEILLDEVKVEISHAIMNEELNGYWVRLRIYFLGRLLKYGGTELWKLSLFRVDMGEYEKRLEEQDSSMADMEIHEHVVVKGKVGKLTSPIRHENLNSLDRYILKHNEYSNWEAMTYIGGSTLDEGEALFGNQKQRRRWLKKKLLLFPGSSLLFFVHSYIIKLGFLDGKQGFIYSFFRYVQFFHIKAKIFEIKQIKK